MKRSELFKQWLYGACAAFTLISVILLLIGVVSEIPTIAISRFLWILPCALCLSAANLLLGAKSVLPFVRRLLHYGITVLSVLCFLILPAGNVISPVTVLLLLVLLTVIYWGLYGLWCLIRSRVRKLMEED